MARICNGYRFVASPSHPRATEKGDVQEHILVAERAMGKPLPTKAVVHHMDGNRSNNDPKNLVVCQDQAYHLILHRRMRALRECGNANWMWCHFCQRWDDPRNMHRENPLAKYKYYHQQCKREDAVRYRRRKREMEDA